MKYLKISALTLIFALTLSACGAGGDNYSSYLGYWESKETSQFSGNEILKVAQISQDGDSYLFQENIMSSKSKPILLTEKEGKLSANTGMGAIDFGLSDDKNTLYVANKSYTKIDETLANKYMQDAEDCHTAKENYKAEIDENSLGRAFLNDTQKSLKEEIQAKYSAEFDRLQPYCKKPF